MRVAHVVRQFSPSIGGLEEAVLKLGGCLQSRGFTVIVVTLDRIAKGGPERLPARDRIGGLDVRRIPFRGSWRYPVAPTVLQAVAEADLVHVHGIDFFFDFLALTRPMHGKPLVASTHGGFFHTTFAQHAKRAYFAAVTRASTLAYGALLASSQADFDLFRPIAGRKLVLAPNGVDVAKWWGLASAEPVRRLIYLGRFSSNKAIPALFPVLHRLRALHPAWALTIAGRPWDVGVDDLRREAARHGVAEAVTILDSPDDATIAGALGTASHVVSASRHEGFGISIVEGMSAGLLPVLSSIPPFETLVRDAGLGVTTDFAAAVQAAERIEAQHRALLPNPAGLRRAAMRASQAYDWSTSAAIVEQTYAAVLNRRAGALSDIPARQTS